VTQQTIFLFDSYDTDYFPDADDPFPDDSTAGLWDFDSLTVSDTQINACDANTDWSGIAATNPPDVDDVDYMEGSGSLKATSTAEAGKYGSMMYNPSGTWDWSHKYSIRFWYKISDKTDVETIRLTIYDSDGNYLYKDYISDVVAGEWQRFEIKFDDMTEVQVSGSFDITAVNSIQFAEKEGTSTPHPTFWVDDIQVREHRYTDASGNGNTGYAIGAHAPNLPSSSDADIVACWNMREGPDWTGCVLRLPFDEGSGSTVYDHSGEGNDGTINGATWTYDSEKGWCLSFDGQDDYTEISSPSNINDLTAFTWSLWVYPRSKGASNYGTMMAKGTGFSQKGMQFDGDSGFTGIKAYVLTDATRAQTKTPDGSLPLNTWTHVVLTYDDSGDRKIHIYLNGTEPTYSQQQAATGTLQSDAGSLFIGNLPNLGSYWWDGLIKEVRIYDYTATSTEASNLYSTGYPRGNDLYPTVWDDCEDLNNAGGTWAVGNGSTVGNTTTSKYGTNAIYIKGGTGDNPYAQLYPASNLDWSDYKSFEIWLAPLNDDGTPATSSEARIRFWDGSLNEAQFYTTLSATPNEYTLKKCELNGSGIGDPPDSDTGIDWSDVHRIVVQIWNTTDNIDMAFDHIVLRKSPDPAAGP